MQSGYSLQTCNYRIEGMETSISIGYRILHDSANAGIKSSRLVFISSGLPDRYQEYLADLFKNSEIVRVQDGETLKSLDGAVSIFDSLAGSSIGRGDSIAYAGGGTLGDVVGFAASTFKRGVGLIAIPTTFLAQIDSAIGGKNGINFRNAKNMIGSFYLPGFVYSDSYFLEGMTDKLFLNGLGELLKYYILNPEEFRWSLLGEGADEMRWNMEALEQAVFTCTRLKMDYVSRDFRDLTGIRRMLNFGHTIGHALESATEFRISHGEAVFWGMMLESLWVQAKGINASRIVSLLRPYLPFFASSRRLFEPVLGGLKSFVMQDKKIARDIIALPFPIEPGVAGSVDMKISDLEGFLSHNPLEGEVE